MVGTDDTPRTARDERAERLAAALRENLKRRKAQARGRREMDKNADDEGGEPRPDSDAVAR